jgi:rRNA maturation protein Nop10
MRNESIFLTLKNQSKPIRFDIYEKENSVARNLKNLVDDYDNDDEIGGVQKINHRPRFETKNRYTDNTRDIKKKRREKNKMRQAATYHQEYEEEE